MQFVKPIMANTIIHKYRSTTNVQHHFLLENNTLTDYLKTKGLLK